MKKLMLVALLGGLVAPVLADESDVQDAIATLAEDQLAAAVDAVQNAAIVEADLEELARAIAAEEQAQEQDEDQDGF